ncbi:MAG: hypothetical protein ACQEXJ_23070 [Myxococcota bacterium]
MSVQADAGHRLEDRIESMASELDSLRRRVDALEGAISNRAREEVTPPMAEVEAPGGQPTPEEDAVATQPGPGLWGTAPALTGRTLVVLGGAFMLRALTEAGTLGESVGVLLGLAYASAWIVMANRAGRVHADVDAAFHGAAACIIAYPLLWESSARLGILPPVAAAMVFVGFSGGLLYLAWRRTLRALAWIVAGVALPTGLLLLIGTGAHYAFVAALGLGAAVVVAASHHRDWPIIRLAVGAAVDMLAVVTFLLVEPGGQGGVAPALAAAVAGAVVVVFVGAFFVIHLGRGARMELPDGAQLLVALGLGLWAALSFAAPGALWSWLVAGAAGAGATVAYRASHVAGGSWPRGTVLAAEAVASALAVIGLACLLSGPALGVALAGVALGIAWPAGRRAHGLLPAHVAVLALAAVFASGAASWVTTTLYAAAEGLPTGLPPTVLGTLGLVGLAYLALRRDPVPERQRPLWVDPATVMLAVVALGVAAAGVALLAPIIAGADRDPGALAVTRTAALTALIWLLAPLHRLVRVRRLELSRTVYVLVAAAALKLLVDDFPHAGADMLTVSFVLLGVSLLFLPRLLRRPAADPEKSAT